MIEAIAAGIAALALTVLGIAGRLIDQQEN